MRAILIGFGNVGRTIGKILSVEKHRFQGLRDLDVKIVGIFTRTKGSLVDHEGVDLASAVEIVERHGRFLPTMKGYCDMEAQEAIQTLDYDVLLELSTLSIERDGEPALSHIKTALQRAKHVVSANKGPLAFAYHELKELAEERKVRLLFESTVMDGAPVFNMVRNCLKGCHVVEIDGILNSTTNYILMRMEEGATLEDAIKEAQEKGFAEADPSNDVDGWDAAAKICVLANVIMGAKITPKEVKRKGIKEVTAEDLKEAREKNKCIKLVCSAKKTDQHVEASVEPTLIDKDHFFATVRGEGAVVRIKTDLMGPIMITQEAPDLYDTAYGVIDDLLTIYRKTS